jgi:hypothetical protein
MKPCYGIVKMKTLKEHKIISLDRVRARRPIPELFPLFMRAKLTTLTSNNIRFAKALIFISAFYLVALVFVPANLFASRPINISVQTILASQGAPAIDGRLSGQIGALRSVFKYSSYQLLSANQLQLGLGQTGNAPLPGGRVLSITPLGIAGNRAQLKLSILKGGQQTFQTVISLLNRGRIIVGGPQFKNGVLIFIISNSF